MTNPYSSLPDYHFWRRAVGLVEFFLLDPVVEPAFRIGGSERVATAGSCFAQHISRALVDIGFNFFIPESAPRGMAANEAKRRNYGVFSARYGNIYTARQLLQLLQEAFAGREAYESAWQRQDGRWADPFRPQIEPDGFATAGDVRASRREHVESVRRLICEMDIFIFTLGLTEAWRSRRDGSVYPLAPGVSAGSFDPDSHEFVNFSVDEVRADVREAIGMIRKINPTCRILLTVSPVPLIATFEKRHVLVSTAASKAILRVAADEAARVFPNVDYFPSYEIITGPHARGLYYGNDLREIEPAGVQHAMRVFLSHYPMGAATGPSSAALDVDAKETAHVLEPDAIVCDEEAIEIARGGFRDARSELM